MKIRIFPPKAKWKGYVWPTKFAVISGYVAIILSLIFFIIPIVFPPSINKKDLETLAKQTDLKNLSNEIKELKKFITRNSSKSISRKYDGLSYSLFLKVFLDTNKSKGYILDEGESISKNRISIYLDEFNNLIFRLIDEFGECQSINVKPSLKTFNFDQLFYLICEYGENRDSSFMRIIINGDVVGNKILDSQINTQQILEFKNRVIGANILFKENASFGVAELIIRNITFTSEEIEEMVDYFDKKTNKGMIVFSKDDFMILDKRTNSLIQPKQQYRPKSIEN